MTDLYVDQADDETVNVGPIITADGSPLAVTGAFTTSLVVKANKREADSTGKTYVGTFAGSSAGWYAQFNIPRSDVATLGIYWYRCAIVDGAGKVQTASAGRWIVDSGRTIGRTPPTTLSTSDIEDGGGANPGSVLIYDGGLAA